VTSDPVARTRPEAPTAAWRVSLAWTWGGILLLALVALAFDVDVVERAFDARTWIR
jgi:hypothetical protein